MQIQINTDHNLRGHESPAESVRAAVEQALSRFSEHITRVEVHLADENAGIQAGRWIDRVPPIARDEHGG